MTYQSTNRHTCIGRLTKDPEKIKECEREGVKFTVAVNRGYEDKNGVSADFFNFSTFGRFTKPVMDFMKKGDLIYTEGTPRIKKRGDKQYIDIDLTAFQLLTPKEKEAEATPPQSKEALPPRGE